MTPEEKANELIEKFYPYSDKHNDSEYKDNLNQKINSIECAIICADNLIQESLLLEKQHGQYYSSRTILWQKVKQVLIDKLK